MSDQITNLINLIIRNENFINHNIYIQGQTGKGDGYLGQINFVTVTGKTQNGKIKTLHIAIKISTQNESVRQIIPIKLCYEKEIYIYQEVVPTLQKFQKEFHLQDDLEDLLPVCYASQVDGNREGLVLENLKIKNYDVWDRMVPMTEDYFKLVLEGFGKWHGLAIALKLKQPEIFQKLVAKNDRNMWPYYIKFTKLVPIFYRYFEEVRNAWKNDKEIDKVYFSVEQMEYILNELTLENDEDKIIAHGDSWTNNFMFQTEKISKKPTKMMFLDWQLSGPATPILDLSVFIYSCVDTDKYQNVEDLLKIYYNSLEKSVHRFDCDLNKIFSFEKLMEHWKKFSCYGLILANFLIRFSLSQSNESPDFASTLESGKEFMEFFDFTISNSKIYHQRCKNNMLHYLKNL